MPPPSRNRWSRVAERLGERIPRDRLEPQVVAAADRSGKRPWVVAVSGGADSTALALLVWAHWPEHRDQLVFAHFNHRLRGRASGDDARFCRALAKALGVTFETASWAAPPSDPSEDAARTARHEFLASVRRRHRAMLIWTGHHLDDAAETVLMRLGRGSGTAGLAAPRAVQTHGNGNVRRLRPLLGLRAVEIRACLRTAGGRWREDGSNRTDRYLRNRLRSRLIPPWEKLMGRDAVAGLGLSRSLLEEDDRALEHWLAELVPIDDRGRLSLRKLEGKPTALWRRALRLWLGQQKDGGDLSRRGFEQLMGLAQRGATSRFSLGQSGFVRIRRGWLFFEQPLGK